MSGSGDIHLLRSTLSFVTEVCDELEIPYAVAGGMALGVWAAPRTTFDVDLVLVLPKEDAEKIASQLRVSDRFPFDPHVMPFGTTTLVRVHHMGAGTAGPEIIVIDLLLYDAAFAAAVAARRRRLTAADGREYWFCSPEDLIVMKLIADRRQDQSDIFAILERRGSELDQEYISHWAEHFAKLPTWQARLNEWKAT